VLATALVVLALLVGVSTTTWQAIRATSAEHKARERLVQVNEALNQSKEAQTQAEEVSRFLVDSFRKSDPWKQGGDLSVREMLDQARSRLTGTFTDQPRIRAGLLDALGRTYLGMSLESQGLELLQEAHEIQLREYGREDPRTIRTEGHLAFALYLDNQLEEATRRCEEVLKRSRNTWRRDDPDSPIPEFLHNLALMYTAAHNLEPTIPLCQEALERTEAARGKDHVETAVARWHLARAYNNSGRPAEALPLAESAVELLSDRLGPDHPNTLAALNFLAQATGQVKSWDEALPLLEDVYQRVKRRFGEESSITDEYALTELSWGYLGTRRYKQLVATLEPALQRYQARDKDHFVSIHGKARLAIAYANLGEFKKALPLCLETMQLARDRFGIHDRATWELAKTLLMRLPIEGAEALLFIRNLLERIEDPAQFGPDHQVTFFATLDLAQGLSMTDRYKEAEPVLENAVRLARHHCPPMDESLLITTLSWLARNQLQQGKEARAELTLQELLGLCEKQGEKTIPPQAKQRLIKALERVVQLYEAKGNKDEAARWRKELQTSKAMQGRP
jgi:tetratricopeptide (TPR) repeat protein